MRCNSQWVKRYVVLSRVVQSNSNPTKLAWLGLTRAKNHLIRVACRFPPLKFWFWPIRRRQMSFLPLPLYAIVHCCRYSQISIDLMRYPPYMMETSWFQPRTTINEDVDKFKKSNGWKSNELPINYSCSYCRWRMSSQVVVWWRIWLNLTCGHP